MTSLWNQRLDHAKRDRHRYRLENENADGKVCRSAKNGESRRRRQRQSGLQKTELQDLQLGVMMYA